MATEIQGAIKQSIFQLEDYLLAQQKHQADALDTTLLATDMQRSVLQALKESRRRTIAYTAYGHHQPENDLTGLLRFNGERRDPITGHYLLGNGYRAFNPVLMRFNSPDSWSPFGRGGLNSYARIDPLNFSDPSGHYAISILKGVYNWALDKAYSLLGQHSKAIKNLQFLGKEFYKYDDFYKGKPRITFDAHSGVKHGARYIISGDRTVTGKQLKSIALKNKVDFKEYSSGRLLVCHSADEINGVSLAQEVANETGLNIKAYHGTVTADPISSMAYKMKAGEVYQPTTKLTVYKNTGPVNYLLSRKSPNYKSVTVHPIRQGT